MASTFSGHYHHAFDPKGRVTIPAKFREQLGTNVTMMRSPTDHCIMVLPLSEWERITRKYEEIEAEENPVLYKKMRRQIATSDDDLTQDRQGRILIPTHLRKFATLDKEVVVAGANRHVEIWDKGLFEAFLAEDVLL